MSCARVPRRRTRRRAGGRPGTSKASGQNVEDADQARGRAARLAQGRRARQFAGQGAAVADVRCRRRCTGVIRTQFLRSARRGARKSQEGATDPVPARWYEAPCFYFTNPHACVGAFDDVERFPGSELFDLELEVGVVYGAYGRNLTPRGAAAGSSATRSSTTGAGTSSGWRASCRSASSRARTAPTRSARTW